MLVLDYLKESISRRIKEISYIFCCAYCLVAKSVKKIKEPSSCKPEKLALRSPAQWILRLDYSDPNQSSRFSQRIHYFFIRGSYNTSRIDCCIFRTSSVA